MISEAISPLEQDYNSWLPWRLKSRHGHEVIPTFLTEETGSCFVRTLPLGERFHCGDWGRAFVVVVGDSSQTPALQKVCFSLSFICVCLKSLILKRSDKSHVPVKCSFLNYNYFRLSRVDSDGKRGYLCKTHSAIYQHLTPEDFSVPIL